MNFEVSDEDRALQQIAHDFLAEHSPLTLCRKILESPEPYARDLWAEIAKMGWLGTAIPETYGGSGGGHLALALIAEEVGRALAPIPFASSVYLATEAILLAGSEAQKKRWLPKLAAGEAIGCFALVEGTGQNGSEGMAATLRDGKASGTKSPVVDGDVADFAVTLLRGDAGTSLAIVELDAPGVKRTALRSLDPSRSIARIEFDGATAEPLGAGDDGARLADRVLDRAAVLLAFEQIGGASRAHDITKQYTLDRYAFGRQIGSFQAIKHKLADLWVDVELARSNAYYGAWALSSDAPELPVAACLARSSACRAFDRCGSEMIQLHGGVGYTWEHDAHLFYRRAKFLSVALGAPAAWNDRLISRLSDAA